MDKELLDSLKPKYTNLKSKIKEINVTLKAQENNMILLFFETKKVKKLLEGLQNDLADINKENVIHHYEFRKDPATESLIASDTGLGTLEHIMTEPHKIASASAESDHGIKGLTDEGDGQREIMTTAKPTVNQATIDLTKVRFTPAMDITIKSPTDCFLSSILHLAGSRLLIGDYYNKKVKVVDMQTKCLVSQISVPGEPVGICHLPGDMVAVTMANKGIQFLETKGQLALGDHIIVDGNCRGIAYHADRLIVSFYYGKVAVLNMNGHVIREIQRDDNGTKLFKRPVHLTVVCEGSTAVIYGSENNMNTITKLDINLYILQTFQDPALKSEVRGITALGDQLLICGCVSSIIMKLDLSRYTIQSDPSSQ